MKSILRKPAFLTATLAAMWLALVLLVLLQFRWSNELIEAYQQRLESTLAASSASFRADFQADLSAVCRSVQNASPVSPPVLPLSPIPFRLYFVDSQMEELKIWNRNASSFEAKPWPEAWSQVRQELIQASDDLASASPRRWFNRPWLASSAAPVFFRATSNEDDSAPNRLQGFLLIELDLPALSSRYFQPRNDRSFAPAGLETRTVVSFLESPVFDSQPTATVSPSKFQALDLLSPSPSAPRFNLRPFADESPWQLRTEHRAGSLDAAVAALRFRNLATGLAVCFVLFTGIVFLILNMRRAEQLSKLQTDFVAGFSHELRTPVTAVCMMAENLSEGLPSEPGEVKHYGKLMLDQGHRLRSRIEDILAFAAGRSLVLDLKPLDLSQVVRAVLSEEAPLLKGFEIDTSFEADLPPVLADLASLKSALINLISNAAKYARDAAFIGIAARTSSPGIVAITISDRGTGIPPAELPMLFEPFFRGKDARTAGVPGSGLGLHLVRTRVEAMGGKVTIESTPGQGTAITIHLRSKSA
ncbi:MAG: HAMP domain-containing sensor histidine kinase [Acidobacteria bacterium]|nr:HAMP domain-containing sensor histidine kinase [Acidobacteriota bacterium]